MGNTKINQLPLYTGNTSGAFFIMNNSGETSTYKVTRETLFDSYTDSIFIQTGSFWNTTNDIGITGSLKISGSLNINNLKVGQPTEDVRNLVFGFNSFRSGSYNNCIGIGNAVLTQMESGSANIGIGNLSLFSLVSGSANIAIGYNAGLQITGSHNITIGDYSGLLEKGDDNFYLNSYYRNTLNESRSGSLMYGKFNLTGANQTLRINAQTTISYVMNLEKQDPLPTGTTGSLAVSGSSLYFHNGTDWKMVSLVP